MASPWASRLWARAGEAWRRDPVEIEIWLDEETQQPYARVGRSKKRRELHELRRRFRIWAPWTSVTVNVPVRHCLVRMIQLPRAALPRADEILQIDLERTTPFRGDVLTGWYPAAQDGGGDLAGLYHVILKPELIVPVLHEIQAAGLPVKAVYPVDAEGERLPVNLLPAAQRGGAAAVVTVRRMLLACLAALCAFTVAAVWLTISSLDTALATMEGDVRKATEEAGEINKVVTEANVLAGQLGQPRLSKVGTTPVLAIWEEVTRLLPESTWLASFRVEEDAAQIEGNSSNASELIPLLAGSPLFRNVAFASPITRDPQRGSERFQIKITIAGHHVAKAGQDAGAPK